jgi:hypothetical protein
MMAAAATWMLYLTRGTTFHYDEWNFVLNRRGHDLDTFFVPHNEHLVALPVFLFKVLFVTVGLTTYWPYQLMPIMIHLACAALMFVLARRRLGAWWALVPAGIVLFFGAAWEAILWPFEISFLIPVAAFLGALALIERRDVRGDAGAGVLLTAGLASSGVGLPMTAGIATYVAFGPRRVVRLLAVVGIPLILYLVWNEHYGVTRFSWDDVPQVPQLVADLIAANLAALAGLNAQFGAPLALLLALVVVLYVLRSGPITPSLAAAAAATLALFATMALFRPGFIASRYYYPGGVLLLLTLVELVPGYLPRRVPPRAVALAGVTLVIVLFGQMAWFLDGGKFFRDWARFVPTSLGAMELARNHVEPGFRPDPVRAPDVEAAKYFDVTKDYGSPADSPAQIQARPEDARENADNVLSAAFRLRVDPSSRPMVVGPVPHAGVEYGGKALRAGSCLRFEPKLSRSYAEVEVPPAGIWLGPKPGANAEVRLRRFGDTYPPGDQPPASALFAGYVQPPSRDFIPPTVLHVPNGGGSLVIPRDRAVRIPWHALVTTDQPVDVCSLRGTA